MYQNTKGDVMSDKSNCLNKIDKAYAIGFIIVMLIILIVGIGYFSVNYNGYDYIINERKVIDG